MRERIIPQDEVAPESEHLFIPRFLGHLSVEGTVGDEMTRDILIEEADEEIESTLKDRPEGSVLLGCGDDRGITRASAAALESKGLPGSEPYIRYFGGAYGVARVALVSETMQLGTKRLRELMRHEDYMHYTDVLSNRAAKNGGVILAAHSAVSSEQNKAELNPDSSLPIACAYAFNVGEITHIAGSSKKVQRLSEDEYKALFGPFADPHQIELAAEANRDFASLVLGEQARDYSIDRTELFAMEVPTMILRGNHAHSEDTFLLANFSADKLTDPNTALEIDRPYYAIDFTQTAETIIKSRPEISYDPEVLFAAMLLDVCATRAALAAHDGGPANPARISLVRYGDPEDALKYLRSLQ
ncbi:MAG: hypothetical protein ACREGG_02645 [Candidatus Saccharimonadales bacterium]